MSTDLLPIIWLGIICLELVLYVVLDGADLGIGLLTLLPQKPESRALLIRTIGPIWDANETWLVVAGGTVFGAFPVAYSIILNALYLPVFLMIFGFILRAVSFEFRAMSTRKYVWEVCFGLGSLLAILGQGFAAGGILHGIAIEQGHFAGGPMSWLSPLSFFITLGVLMSYVVVGYAYVIKRTEEELERQSFRRVMAAAGVTFLSFAAATLFLPLEHYTFFIRWTTEPSRTILLIISTLILLTALVLVYGVMHHTLRRHLHTLCVAIFVLAFIGLLVGVYPYLIPPSLTIFEAAASPTTLRFMLWGIGPLLPIVLAYNFYLYRVFHGRVRSGEEY